MMKIIDVSNERLVGFVEELYSSFLTGFEFEDFLKVYLEMLGLDEVRVTKRSHDGGIDLKALRYGVDGFDQTDAVEYYVQAKRYNPNRSVPIRYIREFRGVMKPGCQGIFITTGKYPKTIEDFLNEDQTRPIILIDGKKLVSSCIAKGLGFVYEPRFSANSLTELMNTKINRPGFVEAEETDLTQITVSKQISYNDIRARILRLPKAIIELIPTEQNQVTVTINGIGDKILNIDKSRSYLGGVTEIYRQLGLISEDGTSNPKTAVWKRYADGTIVITL